MTVLAGPPTREQRARVAVGAVARIAAVATVAGIVLMLATDERTPLWLLGWASLLGAVVAAVGCLVHGSRHAHERGRAFAALVVAFGGLALVIATDAMVTRDCPVGSMGRCDDFGFEKNR